MNAPILHEATRLTEALLDAIESGSATAVDLTAALAHRERILSRLDFDLPACAAERSAADDLRILDERLCRALDVRRHEVASQLARARQRTTVRQPSARLVHESA